MTEFRDIQKENFERAKRNYFIKLGIKVRDAFQMHKQAGLWERKDGKRDWGNVTEHCLVETARVEVFADLLGFTEGLKSDLVKAAALHDFFKKGEKEFVQESPTWEKFEKAEKEESALMRDSGFNERVVRLVNGVGCFSVSTAEEILQKEDLLEDDLAFLVIHYVDDYTVNSEWVKPARIIKGQKINEVDRRMDKNEANERYRQLDEDGRKYFNGKTSFQAQRRIAYQVEEVLSSKIDPKLDPKNLPEYIDQKIKEKLSRS